MKRLAALVVLLLVSLRAAVGSAQEVSDEKKEQAREHFARGVELLEASDYRGAVAEFEAAYELAPFAVIQFNLGVAYDKLGQPVKAVAAMEKVVQNPGNLSAERVQSAKRTIAEQSKRVGKLTVEVGEAGASVRVDGVEIGTSPLGAPVSVAAGTHFVEAVKRGFAPGRQEVSVAGGADAKAAITLEPTELGLGQLWIKSRLPDAEVWLDGVRIGKTPLKQTVPVMPGKHEVELRRVGYDTARDTIELGAGATADLRLEPREDDEAIRERGSQLELQAEAVEDLVVTVDGRRLGPYSGPIALAPGLHEIGVERGGFVPTTLHVDVPANGKVTRTVVLDPTADTVADHSSEVALFRGFSWGTTLAGLALAGAGVGYTVWAAGKLSDAQDALDAKPECTVMGGGGINNPVCVGLAQDIETARGRRPGGYAMIGVGGALVVTGVVLFILTPDADKYRRTTDDDPFADLRPLVQVGPASAFVGLSGAF